MQQSGRIDSQIGKNLRFESSVNSEGIETKWFPWEHKEYV